MNRYPCWTASAHTPEINSPVMFLLVAMPCLAFEVQTNEFEQEIRWGDMPISYQIDLGEMPDSLSRDEWIDAIDTAFSTWSEVEGGSVGFEQLGVTDMPGLTDSDGVNRIWFSSEFEGDEQTGATTTIFLGSGGQPRGFDLAINTAQDWSIDGTGSDAVAALTHEVGHIIGLDHSDVEQATMFASMKPTDQFRSVLHDDDRSGALHLYPQLSLPAALTCNNAPAGSLSLFFLLLPALAVRRTR